jgi:hypothetical protein
MVVRASFVDWVLKDVLPLQALYPTWHRLDGLLGGGNRTIVGEFRHANLKWVVHGDSQFAPIIRAYTAIQNGQLGNPFVVKPATVRKTLDFVPALRKSKQPKLFYAYSDGHF